jgi:hypothetical protein
MQVFDPLGDLGHWIYGQVQWFLGTHVACMHSVLGYNPLGTLDDVR